MPIAPFESLPPQARIWVFASDRALSSHEAELLLRTVDEYLAGWKAHGTPLRSGRELRDGRFLAIGVDPTAEQASGCSIDALFRRLQDVERALGTTLVAGGRVFYRDVTGTTRVARRHEVVDLARNGVLAPDTPAYDTSITDVRAWRERFERPVRDTWVAALLPADQASQPSSRSATNASSVRNG